MPRNGRIMANGRGGAPPFFESENGSTRRPRRASKRLWYNRPRRRGEQARRADPYPAAVLPAEPALPGRREDREEAAAHLLRLRPARRARVAGGRRRRRLPRAVAALSRAPARHPTRNRRTSSPGISET